MAFPDWCILELGSRRIVLLLECHHFFVWLKMQPLNYPGVMQLAMVLVFALGVGYYWVKKTFIRIMTSSGWVTRTEKTLAELS